MSTVARDGQGPDGLAPDTAQAIEAAGPDGNRLVPEVGPGPDSSAGGPSDLANAAIDIAANPEDGMVADRPPRLVGNDAGPDHPQDAPLPISDTGGPVDGPADEGAGVDAEPDGAAGGSGGMAGDAAGTGGTGGTFDGGGGAGDTGIEPDAGVPGPAWVKIAGSSPLHQYPAVGYDPALQRAVLFGGHTNCNENLATNQTWEWDGTAWTKVTPTGQIPSARGSIGMAFDRAHGEAIIHGGWAQPNTMQNGTYTYNLGTRAWQFRCGPPNLEWYAMDYDTDADLVRIFGGSDGNAFFRNVRHWNATNQNWQNVATTGPSARARHAWAFDQEHRRFVMFGGVSNWSGTHLSDTWEYEPATTTWTQTATSGTRPSDCDIPPPMVYDPDRKRVVMYCSVNGGETWEYDAGAHAWSKIVGASQIGAIVGAAMFYDQKLQSILLMGGCKAGSLQDGTWQYIPAR